MLEIRTDWKFTLSYPIIVNVNFSLKDIFVMLLSYFIKLLDIRYSYYHSESTFNNFFYINCGFEIATINRTVESVN
jgi:hypothetical protein